MGNRPGTTNNPDHQKNLTPFSDPERARAAALKSAEVRRANKQKKLAADAVARRDINSWVETYKREDLGDACAAAAQKVAHLILSGEITDQRALVAALPVLVDIARLEAGLHTTATMHANVTMADPMARIRQLQAEARGEVGATPGLVVDVGSSANTPGEN